MRLAYKGNRTVARVEVDFISCETQVHEISPKWHAGDEALADGQANGVEQATPM